MSISTPADDQAGGLFAKMMTTIDVDLHLEGTEAAIVVSLLGWEGGNPVGRRELADLLLASSENESNISLISADLKESTLYRIETYNI